MKSKSNNLVGIIMGSKSDLPVMQEAADVLKELGVEYMLDRTHFVEYTYNEFLNEINNAGLDVLSHNVKFGEIYAICQA